MREEKQCKTALHKKIFLEDLFYRCELNPIDLYLSKLILKTIPSFSESVMALLAHLSLATRNGHLLIKYENQTVLPSVDDLWLSESKISKDDLIQLKSLIDRGFHEILSLPIYESLFSKDELYPSRPLVKFQEALYFQRYFVAETKIIKHLKELSNSTPKIMIEKDKIDHQIKQLLHNETLLKEQGDAIYKGLTESFVLISGGPGTGKTYTAGYLIKVLLESLSEGQKKNFKIALAAPTGKAASNLQNALKKHLTDDFKAMTIHRLLGIKETMKNDRGMIKKLPYDLILVDEASMIDVHVMAKLLSSVKSGSRLIFLGDSYQLPSVEAGAMFSDFVKGFPNHSVSLKTSLRAELKELVDFGRAVNEGDEKSVFKMLSFGDAVKRVLDVEENEVSLFKATSHQFPVLFKNYGSEKEVLEAFNHFRILSPLRKGLYGVDHLNQYFFQKLVRHQLNKNILLAPIILSKNAPKLDLFNGEVGVLVIHPNENEKDEFYLKAGDYALFPSKDHGYRKIPALVIPQYEYAYVLSVHKSQGSEFNHVLALFPEGSEHFGREVLYTAVTRSRKKLEILASDEVLSKTINQRSSRLSGLEMRL